MPKEHEFQLEQDGIVVAGVSGQDRDKVWAEIIRYALQYSQDGPCKVLDGAGKTVCEFI